MRSKTRIQNLLVVILPSLCDFIARLHSYAVGVVSKSSLYLGNFSNLLIVCVSTWPNSVSDDNFSNLFSGLKAVCPFHMSNEIGCGLANSIGKVIFPVNGNVLVTKCLHFFLCQSVSVVACYFFFS